MSNEDNVGQDDTQELDPADPATGSPGGGEASDGGSEPEDGERRGPDPESDGHLAEGGVGFAVTLAGTTALAGKPVSRRHVTTGTWKRVGKGYIYAPTLAPLAVSVREGNEGHLACGPILSAGQELNLPPGAYVVAGPPRGGKTTAMRRLAGAAEAAGHTVVWYDIGEPVISAFDESAAAYSAIGQVALTVLGNGPARRPPVLIVDSISMVAVLGDALAEGAFAKSALSYTRAMSTLCARRGIVALLILNPLRFGNRAAMASQIGASPAERDLENYSAQASGSFMISADGESLASIRPERNTVRFRLQPLEQGEQLWEASEDDARAASQSIIRFMH